MENVTDHTDLRIAMEGKKIDRIETVKYDQPGLESLKLIMTDGTVVYLNTAIRNGGSFLTVDVQ
jgi:hypothetical protein